MSGGFKSRWIIKLTPASATALARHPANSLPPRGTPAPPNCLCHARHFPKWILTMSASRFLVWFHLIYFGCVIPLGAVRRRKRIVAQGQAAPNRQRRYALTSLSLVLFGLLSLVVASRIGV